MAGPQTLRIGTRGSRLAMWQAETVRDLLQRQHPDLGVEIVVIKTLGDRDTVTPLVQLGGVGVFTKEIETALRRDECDIGVHSLKDVPTQLEDDFALVAVLEREDPRDVIVSRGGGGLDSLPAGARVGSSSLRRRSQLLHRRPDLQFCDLRGNVQTRLRAVGVHLDEGKAREGALLDATFLALAGLKRLGLDQHVSQVLEPDALLPAPAQGAVGIEVRKSDSRAIARLQVLDHAPTRAVTTAERTFLRTLEGGCKVPIGALATPVAGGLRLEGVVGDLDGRRLYRDAVEGPDPDALGRLLADRLRAAGAEAILADLRALIQGAPT
ncbi:MAG: hydroxymethylbilane synthase [Pseudomonadota bacterium]